MGVCDMRIFDLGCVPIFVIIFLLLYIDPAIPR
jgi:hypothetical protein